MTYEQITITVRVDGTCPNGHRVCHDLKTTVVKGGHGMATASADCPTAGCGRVVHLSGPFST